jgi:hypothetical protein
MSYADGAKPVQRKRPAWKAHQWWISRFGRTIGQPISPAKGTILDERDAHTTDGHQGHRRAPSPAVVPTPTGRVDGPLPGGVGLPPRIDPWQRTADLAIHIEMWARTMRLAATLGEPSLLGGRLVLHPVADFFLHSHGWTRVETAEAVVWQGPQHLPPVWRVGKRHRYGWALDPSLWTGDGQDGRWREGQAALLARLDTLHVVGERGLCVEETVLPWWLLPGLEPQDGPSTQAAIERVQIVAGAFTVQLLDHAGPFWWRLAPPAAQGGVPRWHATPCRLAAASDGRSFADVGDRVQANAVAGPVLAELWGEPGPRPIDRLTLPGCPTQRAVAWAWELPGVHPPSAHAWMAKTGIWRAVAKKAKTRHTTPTGAPPRATPKGLHTIGPGMGGVEGPVGRIEQHLAGQVRERRIAAIDGRLFLAHDLECDRHWTTDEGLSVWAWARGNGQGCVGLVGWRCPQRPKGWTLHPDLFSIPSHGTAVPRTGLEAEVEGMDVVVQRAELRRGGVLPWWALGAEEPRLPLHAQLFWDQMVLAVQAFLVQQGAEHTSVLLCPPHHKDHHLEWAKPMLRWEGTADIAFAGPFQRILLPLVERAFAQPTCRLLPGHTARAVWRMVGNPAPFPSPIAHPGQTHSAHRALAMAGAWADLLGEPV